MGNNKIKRILMFTSKEYDYNPVIRRQCKTLIDNGYYIKIIEWNRNVKFSVNLCVDKVDIEKVPVKFVEGSFLGLITKLPSYFLTLLRLTKDEKFDVIHCHDMHTIFTGVIIGKLRRCKVVYDAHDIYYFNSFVPLKKIMSFIDLFFAKFCDLVITPCYDFCSYFKKINDNTITIWNVPEHDVYLPTKNTGSKKFIIGHFGCVRFVEPFLTLFDAVKDMDNVSVIIGGIGKDLNKLRLMAENYTNVSILNATTPSGVIKRYRKCNCIYAVYPVDNAAIMYSVPMKIFDAMSFGLPVITNDIGYAGAFVRFHNIGSTLEDITNSNELNDIIVKLNVFHTNIAKGINGRELVEGEYNWDYQSKKLVDNYRKML